MSVQLYTHSEYSLLESVLSVENLVAACHRLGYRALALTDHNSTAGHWELDRCCQKAGLKPIFGVELDLAVPGTEGPCQVTLLALDNMGYRNLLRLASFSLPLTPADLLQYKEGVALLEGGTSGGLTRLLAGGKVQACLELYRWYLANFAENFYLRHELGQDLTLFEAFPEAEFVLSQDVRYLQESSRAALEVLGSLRGGEVKVPSHPLLSWDELIGKFKGPRKVLETTLKLAERCRAELPRAQDLPAPSGSPPLEDLAWQGARRRFGELRLEVEQRLKYELQVITELGYANYFLIVADLVRFAKGAGIPVGPGRGSAAGSLTAYVLGITEVNPLEWGLLFERFLNPERASKPDIDLDFCYERRGEVLAYLAERYGREYAAQIGTYGTFGAKAAAQEVERVLGRSCPQLTAEIQGLKRHRSTHAAGVVLSHQPIQNVSAVYQQGELPVTHLDMYALEDLGVLKIDLLGLRTLTLLRRMEEEVQKVEPEFSLAELPLADPQTFELLGQGRSLGLFQLESALFQDLLRRLKPRTFQDLVALLALGRPGPLKMFPEYLRRRDDPQRITYLHPVLEEILAETYGLILYQEQVMAIAHRLAGFSLGQADLLRRALAKGEDLGRWRARFLAGAQGQGLSAKEAGQLFEQIARFSGYAFNKAHSVSYALITWRAAYLKSHYPAQFFTVLLSEGGSRHERGAYLREAQSLGVQVLCPSVLYSQVETTLEGNSLRLGLSATRRIIPHKVQAVLEARKRGSWTSLAQLQRAAGLDGQTLETLILAGALDDLGERSQHLLQLGLAPRTPLELLEEEKELLGAYISGHPCDPFQTFADRIRGEWDAAVGEILEIKEAGRFRQGLLDSPRGTVPFQAEARGLVPGRRIALFGRLEGGLLQGEWLLPLGPMLLITPRLEDLPVIKDILEGENGSKPTLLLFQEAYQLLPPPFWVGDGQKVSQALDEKGIVYTWFDPWKENV